MSEMNDFYIGRADLKLKFENETPFNGKIFLGNDLIYHIPPYKRIVVHVRDHPEWVGNVIHTFNLFVSAFTLVNSVLSPYTLFQGDPMKSGFTAMKKDDDMINNPSHYQGNVLEVIDVIEDFHLNFSLGNAVKYILRANKKKNKIEDLQKAIWYIQREIQSYEN